VPSCADVVALVKFQEKQFVNSQINKLWYIIKDTCMDSHKTEKLFAERE